MTEQPEDVPPAGIDELAEEQGSHGGDDADATGGDQVQSPGGGSPMEGSGPEDQESAR